MEKFDGYTVDKYEGKFAGLFDLEDAPKFGDTGLALVVYRVGPATFKENSKTGDIVRVSTFVAEDVVHLTGDEADDLLVAHGFSLQLSLNTDPSSGAEAEVAEEPSTEVDPEDDDSDDWGLMDTAAWSPETGERVSPSPSTVGASQAERDPMLAKFLATGK